MGAKTGIAWCDMTFNPWWGCTKISPACKNCYAEGVASRFVGVQLWGEGSWRKPASESYWKQPLAWNRAAEREGKRYRVFCGSMCDVMEDRPDLEGSRNRLFQLITDTPNLDWLLLTKRPENFRKFLPWISTPWPNVWLGTTVENQEYFDKRSRYLVEIPAAVRFLSVEPQLGQIDADLSGIDWVICGGESGPGARPMNIECMRSVKDQCTAAGVAYFGKQICERGKPIPFDQFPEDLQIRKFPEVRR